MKEVRAGEQAKKEKNNDLIIKNELKSGEGINGGKILGVINAVKSNGGNMYRNPFTII